MALAGRTSASANRAALGTALPLAPEPHFAGATFCANHCHFCFTTARVCSWLRTAVPTAMPTTIRVSSAYGKSSGRRSKLLQGGTAATKPSELAWRCAHNDPVR